MIPGFYVAALLYEPTGGQQLAPAILNVNGHIYGMGKEIEYKQKRCINQAKQGIFALNLEWLYFGELAHPENDIAAIAARVGGIWKLQFGPVVGLL